MEFLWMATSVAWMLMDMSKAKLSFLISLVLFISKSEEGPNEKRLLEHLFVTKQHNRLERPVYNETQPLIVFFGLVLQQIIDVDEKNEIINTNLWLNLAWNDYNLAWNESEYGGIKTLRLPAVSLWKPDILMYNSADEDIDSTFPTNVVLSSTGDCLWVPPGLFRSTCKIDITWFPFDDQMCSLKFGSWTYDSLGIDLRLQSDAGDTSSFIPNGEWQLIGMPAIRNVKSYECCPEQYIDVTFTIHIRRRTLYYGFNLILPCVLISSMALLTFTLPPDAGEKISLGVTILLSLTVFLLLVAETMPPTSDAVPLIGMYFASIMLMCSLSVVFTVLVLNCHYRTPDTHQMPQWVRKGICEWLANILFIRKSDQNKKTKNRNRAQSSSSKDHKILDPTGNSSKSLLANVLDIDDDLIVVNSTTLNVPTDTKRHGGRNGSYLHRDIASSVVPDLHSSTSSAQYVRYNPKFFQPLINADNSLTSDPSTAGNNYSELHNSDTNATAVAASSPISNYDNSPCSTSYTIDRGQQRCVHDDVIQHHCLTETYLKQPTTPQHHRHHPPSQSNLQTKRQYGSTAFHSASDQNTSSVNRSVALLVDILKEVRFLTDGIKAESKKEDECNEWKFAAMVIDRLCLVVFTCFTLISTVAILFSAPHIIV